MQPTDDRSRNIVANLFIGLQPFDERIARDANQLAVTLIRRKVKKRSRLAKAACNTLTNWLSSCVNWTQN